MKELKLENQICFPLYTVSRLMTKAYKPYLEQLGLTYPQYLVLMVLWESHPKTVHEISSELMLESNTLSPMLKRMEKAEFITRNRSESDERCVLIDLTEKGRGIKTKASHIPLELGSLLADESYSEEDIIKLKSLLNQWISKLSKQ
ncbi:MAG: MarR family winged helix-turn-helix transcriptional regulator [Flavobacteriaceae bacterium]